ncbi:hypothetical protein M2475_001744 [Breznakia sp. PF5-3]|uniref:bacterial Ig-like domain-containing protein n=1 Tax=unclassified Breznakia TaxID=2623764 RepID=UPI002406A3AB|nr:MULTISPECIES: bacterial Ig-like domain-containing protein [unclassified Breznakia]MDF9825286.1 hypothetical protein [Breznakia sp. PM6-1]MDF9836168.1 hypothetical protein [Breznakia sp. PF5-3]MDF9837386.1 hypothetical protein [Breznakia sp. PFB2-8]MDF9859321.1 hypothetical protein [Breznakia sp. PH5-24]
MKKIIMKSLVLLLAITTILPMSGITVAAAEGIKTDITITRNNGNGAYGEHTHPSYVEDGVQYYREGDIIELDIALPANHGASELWNVVKYDPTQVAVVSTKLNVQSTLGDNYRAKGYEANTNLAYQGTQGLISTTIVRTFYGNDAPDFDTAGGTTAKIYFRVLNDVETVEGTEITFEFPIFQAISRTSITDYEFIHEGFDANRYAETRTVSLESQTIIAKKPTVDFIAEDGFITRSQAQAIGESADLKPYNFVSATASDGQEVAVKATTSSLDTIKAGTLGTYDVTYSYTFEGTPMSKTVKLTVVENDVVISEDRTVALRADSVILTQTQAKALSAKEALLPLNNVFVYLSNGTTATANVDVPEFDKIKAGTIGTYNATYSYGIDKSFASKTVNVVVVKDGSDISDNKKVSLYAKDGFIRESQARALSLRSAVAPYNSAVVTLADGSTTTPTTEIEANAWNKMRAGTLGTYNVYYHHGTGDSEVEMNVKATVISDDAVVSKDETVSLVADDVDMYQEDAKALGKVDDLIDYANAEVTLSDGTKVAPSVETDDFDSIKAGIIGEYEVTFKYGEGDSAVEKTVTITIKEDLRHLISATDNFITQSKAQELTSKESLRAVNSVSVTDYNGVDQDAVVTTSDFNTIKAGTLGSYIITYSYGTGTKEVSVTAKVNVIPDDSIVDGDVSLYARDKAITVTQAKALNTKEDLIPYNEASVRLLDGTTPAPSVAVSVGDWSLINSGKEGSYNVTYSYGTVSKTVKITVVKDGSEESEDKTATLYAKNAFITVSDAKKVSNKTQLIPYNKAEVVLASGDKKVPDVTISNDDLLAISAGTIGGYNVLYSYGSGKQQVQKMVKIVVIADDPIISEDESVALSANDEEIDDAAAKKLTSRNELIDISNAVVTFDDGTTQAPTLAVADEDWDAIRSGKLGTYSLTYSYGTLGNKDYVTKTVSLTVVKLTEDRTLFDYNRDNIINSVDYMYFHELFNNPQFVTPTDVLLSDANGDGYIDMVDLGMIHYYVNNPKVKPPTIKVPIG